MNNKMEFPNRKRNRMADYDYSLCGAYFVTICVKDKLPILWEENSLKTAFVSQHNDDYQLSEYGKIINDEINKLNTIYSGVWVDMYCIMPDHIHLIVIISQDNPERPKVSPTLSRIIQQFKGSISKRVGFSFWQKSFHDHIIRNKNDYTAICKYIEENPSKYLLS